MSSLKPKELRKSLRNVVQEILPELLTKELESALYKTLEARVKKLEDDVKAELKVMQERHKSTMDYLVRQVSQPASAPAPKSDPK